MSDPRSGARQLDPGVSHQEEIERWRAWRVGRLTGPDGWLAVVGLAWLEEGSNPIGASHSNRVVLPTPDAPSHMGSIDVTGGNATIRLRSGSGAVHGGQPVTTLALRDDDGHKPTVIELGSLRFHLIRREGRLAVRMRDAESPARRKFSRIDYFPVDDRWRLAARFEAFDPPRRTLLPTVTGGEEAYEIPGAVAFEVDGRRSLLEAYSEAGETDLFIIFGDRTNGVETFGGGRYMYAAPPDDDGAVVLDFNKAYNPPCVFTPHATCALPRERNRLEIRVEAGEKRYGEKA
jgi:uncharacterized protein (DUF1684 family)